MSFEHDTIKLIPGVHLADGTRVSIEPETPTRKPVVERYSRLVGIADDLPEDLARNHDGSAPVAGVAPEDKVATGAVLAV